MLELQLPRSMSHTLPREPSFDFHFSSSVRPTTRFDSGTVQMHLPVPRMSTGYELPAPRRPLTPPAMTGSAVKVMSLPPSQCAGQQHGYQLPAIGNSRSATVVTSPATSRQQQQHSQEVAQTPRKKWSISPNLRIPSTINTPQEGLPQLAAEITCLFWFESSKVLNQVVADSKSPIQHVQALVPDAIPTSGFRKWVATILTTTQVAQNVILLALLFVWKLKQTNPSVKGKPGSEYRLLTVALMLGNKFLDDNTYTNKTWAEVSGISVQEVHIMEVEFLSNMRYSLYTSKEKWEAWHKVLGKFGTFYDRARKVPAAGTISPSLAVPQNSIPSPQTNQTSPPTTLYSPNPLAFSNSTPLLQPQATSAQVSPIGSLPPLGPIVQRKRSTDNTAEPPMKRQAHGFAPGPYSNAPLVPTSQLPVDKYFEPPPSTNRLPPLPSLAIPPPQQQHMPPAQLKNWSELPLPVPGNRSMAMVYPPPVQWQQPVSTPTSSAAPPFSTHHTPTADRSRQISPFTHSNNSSPTSVSFPTGSRQLSPSYFLNQRQSPYRPVRGVHTLLVPPPQASIQNPARNISEDQMHYHPLGRPMTDRRAGPLPYMDHSAWPEQHQFNQLPVPHQPVFR
ncbi:hypothetical protein C7974DRAFT_201246 [Boeremia exigua]|uniref:uncharacterized protein n=1 Tax=Boeremia exigua TaxID=749465 RepID=UPI001E8DBADB|nr:uncharacterized protein C7974DRAFT_201246 [Boeremia exigua]KAH6625433.1 hypothetical protein C7974DRAFT_201246 [Boeremia exigua]